ncbi:MAG: hypothetical protein ABIS67_12355 [Candidatus Eisenbacteria bacterium]
MHFLDAWTSLPILDQLRLLAPALVMALAIMLPGRRLAAVLALGLAITIPVSGAIPGGWALAAGWGVLWLVTGGVLYRAARAGMRRPAERRGGFESTLIGLMLGVPLFGLLAVAIARQNLPFATTRDATAGALFLALGLIHLMVRRHVLRSVLGWGFAGFGLQALQAATAASLPASLAPPKAAVLLATAITLALVLRIGLARARWAGSAWLSDAHDLHD